jgi:hypothetical protein
MRGAPLAAIAVASLLIAMTQQERVQTPTEPHGTVVTFWSGEEMLNYCSGANQAAHEEGCTGFAMGVADTAAEASAAGSMARPFRVCRPAEATGSQALDVVLQYLQARPDELQFSAASLAIQALAAAWPCS